MPVDDAPSAGLPVVPMSAPAVNRPSPRKSGRFSTLKSEGRRAWKRFVPTEETPVFATVTLPGGRKLKPRLPVDISMKGAALGLGYLECNRLRVGQVVRIDLRLPSREIVVRAKVVHVWTMDLGFMNKQWRAGLQFQEDPSYAMATPYLGEYLLLLSEAL